MATKPEFAQKLLHDLCLRKQSMATAQNSGKFNFGPALDAILSCCIVCLLY
ncbi:hypothetical protein BVRB_5g108230 [Beta vulgaris subsp. vulgaris]|nr:hypothetical protein BVRB_5g108230 [Beta vulgaris subsp. vulgaris]